MYNKSYKTLNWWREENATHLPLRQPIKAVMDRQHIVTLDDAHSHSRADGGVHTSTGSTDVHDGYVDVALVGKSEICLVLYPAKMISVDRCKVAKWMVFTFVSGGLM